MSKISFKPPFISDVPMGQNCLNFLSWIYFSASPIFYIFHHKILYIMHKWVFQRKSFFILVAFFFDVSLNFLCKCGWIKDGEIHQFPVVKNILKNSWFIIFITRTRIRILMMIRKSWYIWERTLCEDYISYKNYTSKNRHNFLLSLYSISTYVDLVISRLMIIVFHQLSLHNFICAHWFVHLSFHLQRIWKNKK